MFNPIIAAFIKSSGRSWWQARYSSGKAVSEWDTLIGQKLLPIGLGRSSRWEEVEKKGMVGLRLLCPNGMAGELEAPEDYKFFQLKVGYFDIQMNKGGSSRSVKAHLIGVVENAEGDCQCKAWENPGNLISFKDNIYNMKYQNIGLISLTVQELKV
jgi:hypothetical protein